MTNDDTGMLIIPITARDRRALMSADSIVFRLRDGQSTIEAHRDGSRTADGFDGMHAVYCETWVSDYARSEAGTKASGYAGFYMKHTGARYDDVLRTVVDLLSTGVTVRLTWTAANNNQNNREIGWVRDELRLTTVAPDGKRTRTFLIAVQVGPNDTARMITGGTR
jgi:hypothetical protein